MAGLSNKPAGDFANYYFSARIFWEGPWGAWIFDPALFNDWIEGQGYTGIFGCFSPFPPADALFMVPLLPLSLIEAKWGFVFISCGIFIFQLWRWFRLEQVHPRAVLVIPLLFYRPILSNIEQGQVYLLLFSLVLEGYFSLRKGNEGIAAFCFGVAFWVKIFPFVWCILFLFPLTLRKSGFLFLSVLGLLFGFALFQGLPIWSYFLSTILPAASEGLIIDRFAVSFQSWNAFFAHAFLAEGSLKSGLWISSDWAFYFSKMLVSGLVIGALVGLCQNERPGSLSFFAASLAGILLTPTGTLYALLPSVSAIPYLFSKENPPAKPVFWVMFIGLLLACWFPFHHLEMYWPIRFGRLLILFLIFLLLLRKDHFSSRYLGIAMLLFFPYRQIATGWGQPRDFSEPVEMGPSAALLLDYTLKDHQLHLWVRQQEGRKVWVLPFFVADPDTAHLSIRKNNICLNGQILFSSPERKKKPILAGKTIYYLSEKNRGPGFFVLRQFKIRNEP